MKLTLGQIRKKIQPLIFRYWLRNRARVTTRTRIAGLDIEVFPGVFHPRYFGSSRILASFIETLDLGERTLLDMGTGSGVIGLRAARSGARVTSVDVNPAAVACARSNAISNAIELEVIESDLFDSLDGRSFDSVVWNPPFFPKKASSPAEGAFLAGEDFGTVRRFAAGLRSHLNRAGRGYLILSLDVDVARVERFFVTAGFETERVLTRRWGLGEKMVILEFR